MLVLLVIAASALAIRRLGRHGDQFSAVCVGAVVMLLISPISWEHHWVWVLPLMLALVPHRRAQKTLAGWAVSIGFIVALWVLFANNPALIAAHFLGDLNADYYFYATNRVQAMVATLPVIAASGATAWISVRPQDTTGERPASEEIELQSAN